jgi:hypothetical protein
MPHCKEEQTFLKQLKMEKENPNELAVRFSEKHLQGKPYDFIIATAEYLKKIAETTCKLPILTEEN